MPGMMPMGAPMMGGFNGMGGFPGMGGPMMGMGGPFPGMFPGGGISGPAMTGGHPFFPGAPGAAPMVNPSLNYLQNILQKQEEESKRLMDTLNNINQDDGNFDAIAK
jgi:hypothetical protein